MKEVVWAKQVAEKLDADSLLKGYRVEAGKRLVYANEILKYCEGGKHCSSDMSFQTDLLVYEQVDDGKEWKPRVVIETKNISITTDGAITYSRKSEAHKLVHPYLRYGILIGNREEGGQGLPGRLFRHGAHFDFMISWRGYEALDYEWKTFTEIIKGEIDNSKKLEKMFYESRKKGRDRYYAIHKPLKMTHIPKKEVF